VAKTVGLKENQILSIAQAVGQVSEIGEQSFSEHGEYRRQNTGDRRQKFEVSKVSKVEEYSDKRQVTSNKRTRKSGELVTCHS